MFSFFKKKDSEVEIPEWASFFDKKEYLIFIKEIDKYFKSIKVEYKIAGGQIIVKEEVFGSNNLGLVNIAQICKQDEKRNYKENIVNHFEALTEALKFDKEFKEVADNFEETKKYIGVRLYDNDYISHIGKENAIGKALAGDIFSMLVFDFPHSVVSITPEQTTTWNKTTDELFEIGIINIQNKYPLNIKKESFGEFHIWFINEDHFFTPNIVFDIENKRELIGSHGSLIGLPHRHSAIIYPIENLEVLKVINGLAPAIYGMNQEGPGSLSNNLFWYNDMTFTQLPYHLENGKLQFFPPDNFLEMLNTLNEDEKN